MFDNAQDSPDRPHSSEANSNSASANQENLSHADDMTLSLEPEMTPEEPSSEQPTTMKAKEVVALLSKRVEELIAENTKLKEQFQDELLRLHAEMDNARKRAERQAEEAS